MNAMVADSTVSPTALLAEGVRVERSTVGAGCKLYRNAWLRASALAANCIMADNAKVDDSALGEYVTVGGGNHFFGVEMGRHSYTGLSSVLMRVKVGAFCSLSWNVTIGGAEHDLTQITTHNFLCNPTHGLWDGPPFYDRFADDCVLGNDVWVAAGAVVLRGAAVGDGAVVGAGAVVTKDVPPYAVVAGNPAKVIKYRFDGKTIARLRAARWWDLPDGTIRKHARLFAKHPDDEALGALEQLRREHGEARGGNA